VRLALRESDKRLRGEEAERHAVPAVAEREELPRMTAVRTDVGQAVGRRREQTLPGVRRFDAFERRIEIDEVARQLGRFGA
jgi:hypothetical protein